jgi:hypothetical protein
VAADSSLVVRIMASQQDEVGLSLVIRATSLAGQLDRARADTIDVLPRPVSLKTNRDLLKRPPDQLVVLSVNQRPHRARHRNNNSKQELVLP